MHALCDQHWVVVCNAWAIGPVDGVLGAAVHPLFTAVVAAVVTACCVHCHQSRIA